MLEEARAGCFSHVAVENAERFGRNDAEALMAIDALHEQGIAVPTYTTLDGKFAIRVAHTNHRTRYADFDLLVREVVRLGQGFLHNHKEQS